MYIPKSTSAGGRPLACQLSTSTWGTCDNINYLGGTGAFCRTVTLLDGKNMVCIHDVPYFFDGGFPSGTWVDLPNWPNGNVYSHDCDATAGVPLSCLSRPEIADVNPSRGDGQAYITIRLTTGANNGGHFTKVT